MKSCYEILEVSESASAEQIRSAYLKMACEYHPDRVPEHLTKLRADAEDKFKQVQGAWAVLGDAAKRGAAFTASPCTSGPGRHSGPSPPQAGLGVRWTLLVLIATLVLVVIGEVAISRDSANSPDTTTAEITKPAKKGAGDSYELNVSPRHIQTWEREGGKGLEIQLVSATARFDELEVSFRVRAGDHGNLLLFEPPGASGQSKKILGSGGSRFRGALRGGQYWREIRLDHRLRRWSANEFQPLQLHPAH